MKKKVLHIVLALSLLTGLFYLVGVAQLIETLAGIELVYLVYLGLLSVMMIWVSCLKWQLFVRAAGHDVRISKLMSYYTMSYFFNMFMPSTVGGDVARSVQLGYHLKSFDNVFAATFVERLTGFLAMNLIAVTFVAVGVQVTEGVELVVLIVAMVTLIAAVVLFSPGLSTVAVSLFAHDGLVGVVLGRAGLGAFAARLESFLRRASRAMDFARSRGGLFWAAMGYSVVFHFLTVVNTYTVARCLGWHEVDFFGLCVVVPMALLVSVAPLTPAGVGVQEGAFLYFLTRLGATRAQGLGVGIILRAKSVIIAFIGGLLYLSSRSRLESNSVSEKLPSGEAYGG